MWLGSFTQGLYRRISQTIGGIFAITTQNFTELNSKRGQQWDVFELYRGLGTGEDKHWLLRTGSQTVILKNRALKTNSNDLEFLVSTDAVITDAGATNTVGNLNAVYQAPVETTFHLNPTVSSTGNPRIFDWVPGANTVGGRTEGGFATEGLERILAPNTDHLIIARNQGDSTADVSIYLTFYEGVVQPLGPDDD
jgi:hypothetical protein